MTKYLPENASSPSVMQMQSSSAGGGYTELDRNSATGSRKDYAFSNGFTGEGSINLSLRKARNKLF